MRAIGLVSALGFEAAAARRHPRLVVRRCNVGGHGAARAVGELHNQGCAVVVSWGAAGALDGDNRSGSVYLADRVLARDGARIDTDRAWQARFRSMAAGKLVLKTGLLVSSPGVVASPDDKRRLARASGAGAVDMESDRVGAACAEARMPFLVIRCILDESEDRLPDHLVRSLGRDGSLRVARFLSGVLRHPEQWAAMGGLARRWQRVRRNLARAAAHLARCA